MSKPEKKTIEYSQKLEQEEFRPQLGSEFAEVINPEIIDEETGELLEIKKEEEEVGLVSFSYEVPDNFKAPSKLNKKIEITSSLLVLEANEEKSLFFIGFSMEEFGGEYEHPAETVNFLDENRNRVLCPSTVVVNSIKKVVEASKDSKFQGWFALTNLGDRKSKGSKIYKDIKVEYILPE